MRAILLAVILIFSLQNTGWAQAGKQFCDMQKEGLRFEKNLEKILKKRGLSLETTQPSFGKDLAPFSMETQFGKISSREIYRSLSGFYCDSVDRHTTIYHHSNGVTVVGVGYEKSFPMNKVSEAFDAYLMLIKKW